MTKMRLAVLSLIAFATGATPAYAYLDPGTGSMVLQAILGGIAGVVIAGKLYWGRVKDWISRLSGRH
ncbi:MAG: hypothetical protein ACREV0_09355 [Burkholderiales bacterium]